MGSEMYYGSYQFTPVPILDWSTETVYDNKLDRIFLRHTAELNGSLLSPAAESGRLDYLLSARKELQEALAADNKEFRILYNGVSQVSGIYPRVTNINFTDDIWVNRLDYSFSLVWDDDFYGDGIQSWGESWDFSEEGDRRTVTASHSINAVGIDTNPSGANNAFTNARSFVLGKTGYSNAIAGTPAFTQVSGSYNAYELATRQEIINAEGGAYSVTETFVLSSGTYNHTYTEDLSVDDTGVATISIDGNIQGHGRGDTAYNRAIDGWNTVKETLPSVASGAYSALWGESTLYTQNYDSLSVSRNTFDGTVSYTVSYTDSSAENLPSGILEFALNVQDNKPTRVYASFAIPERALGNVVQDIQTSSEGSFSINGNATAKQSYNFDDLVDWVETKINDKRPNSANYQTLRLASKQITKDEDNKTIQFNVTWAYTVELSQAAIDGYVTLD